MFVVLVLAGCTADSAQPTPSQEAQAGLTAVSDQPTAESLTTNIVDGCVENYDESLDYFPEKVSFERASNVSVEYFNNYKLVMVRNPWRDGEAVSYEYVLVQCGTPAPAGLSEDALVIEVPVSRFVALSTTQLPQLELLEELDSLVGIESLDLVNTAAVRSLVESGAVAELGTGAEVNIETTLDLEPDVAMTIGYGIADLDAQPVLLEAGIATVLNAGYREESPLGRAEWLKFMALFFNKEALAEKRFTGQVEAYEGLAALTADVGERPTVLANAPFRGTWNVPGGESYFAQFLADAGANYLWANEAGSGSIPLDFEVVFDRAAEADFWVNPSSSWLSLADAQAADERYADFAAFENHIYNNNARLNESGGNDYWETGVAHPEMILADLIKIFHPELLPEHELVFYHLLQ